MGVATAAAATSKWENEYKGRSRHSGKRKAVKRAHDFERAECLSSHGDPKLLCASELRQNGSMRGRSTRCTRAGG